MILTSTPRPQGEGNRVRVGLLPIVERKAAGRAQTHPHPVLLLEGEGVMDKDNSIRWPQAETPSENQLAEKIFGPE